MMNEYKQSTKDVPSSLNAYWKKSLNVHTCMALSQTIEKVKQDSLNGVSCLLHEKERMAGMAKFCPHSQTDIIFVAMNALVERINVEDLIAKRNVTAMSYPCVLDLTFCFSESFASWLHPWLPNSQLTFRGNF